MNRYLWSVWLWLLSGLAISGSLQAGEQAAKQAYEAATQHFLAGDFRAALNEFKTAYNESGRPEILYNIGVTHEKLGEGDHAVAYYRLYLEELPDASDRSAVESRIEVLTNAAQELGTKEPSVEENETGNGQASSVATNPDAGGIRLEKITPKPVTTQRPSVDKQTLATGLLLGGGGLLLATGVITGIAAFKKQRDYKSVCAPDCSDKQVTSVQRTAIAADVQMGVGVVALSVGIIWMSVNKKRGRARHPAKSAWLLTPGPSGVLMTGAF